MENQKNEKMENSGTFNILLENKFNRNPNGITLFWEGEENLPFGTTWTCGYGVDVIPTEWGFQIFTTHGKIAPSTKINFPKYATEQDFNGAFIRLMQYITKNYDRQEALPAYNNVAID